MTLAPAADSAPPINDGTRIESDGMPSDAMIIEVTIVNNNSKTIRSFVSSR
jgi:hypothetical protein